MFYTHYSHYACLFKGALHDVIYSLKSESFMKRQSPVHFSAGSACWFPHVGWSSCFFSLQTQSDTRGMPGFISGRPGLCGPSARITTRCPAKIFTAHGRVQFTVDAIIRADDDAGDAMHHVGGNGGLRHIQSEKENNSEVVLFAFLAGIDGQTCVEPTLNRRVSPQCWCVFFFVTSLFMISTRCDKSQRRLWDGFMTSFTLHFQP